MDGVGLEWSGESGTLPDSFQQTPTSPSPPGTTEAQTQQPGPRKKEQEGRDTKPTGPKNTRTRKPKQATKTTKNKGNRFDTTPLYKEKLVPLAQWLE